MTQEEKELLQRAAKNIKGIKLSFEADVALFLARLKASEEIIERLLADKPAGFIEIGDAIIPIKSWSVNFSDKPLTKQ